ncbi:NUDIX hydrolase [Angomonas deanei]|uniref:NUDIX domain containing protein, putative n=1 Tax=Angomonas deanei TaxID=59799 RepID=A0A7G2CKF8_9TRYP|nr:NUDIX hydrolase [Angomonas deanei]CAD2219889.1 NUDIX domain containing protein, putative [Angomonas deanei]|eukprot:EPY27183.1 NUDIX hydrolase [Angomonas deanei]
MYRPNVCVILFNEYSQFLGCQRISEDSYQCVQGGIEEKDLKNNNNNGIIIAALREIEEEIGIKKNLEDVLLPENNNHHNLTTEFETSMQKNEIILKFITEIYPPDGDGTRFRYLLPPKHYLCTDFGFIGQQQRLLLFFLSSNAIRFMNVQTPKEYGVPPEFRKVEWMTMKELTSRCPNDRKLLFQKYISTLCPPAATAFLVKYRLLRQLASI